MIPGSGRSPGEGNDNPLQYSSPENPTDRRAWQAIVHGVAKSPTQLSTHTQRCDSVHENYSSRVQQLNTTLFHFLLFSSDYAVIIVLGVYLTCGFLRNLKTYFFRCN